MKALAIILIVLVLAAVGAVGYLYLKADLTVRFDSCIATAAVTQLDYFNQLKSSIANQSFVGTLYSNAEPDSAENYQFLTYTVSLSNHAFLEADVVEIHITPMQGDVLQLGDELPHTLPANQSMKLSTTILTTREMHNVREATVTCYFWGIPFTTRLTLGSAG